MQQGDGVVDVTACGYTVADPRRAPPVRAPYGPKISQFHAIFRKIWQHFMLAPSPPEGWHPLLQGILDPSLVLVACRERPSAMMLTFKGSAGVALTGEPEESITRG